MDIDGDSEFINLSKVGSWGKSLFNKAKGGVTSLWNRGKKMVTPTKKKPIKKKKPPAPAKQAKQKVK